VYERLYALSTKPKPTADEVSPRTLYPASSRCSSDPRPPRPTRPPHPPTPRHPHWLIARGFASYRARAPSKTVVLRRRSVQ
jgi:hypothetical protein